MTTDTRPDFGSPDATLTANGVPHELSGGASVAHTPGPWEARAGNVYVLGGGAPLHFCGHTQRHDGSAAAAERAANARLVAASPELLAALERLVSAITDGTIVAAERRARALIERVRS